MEKLQIFISGYVGGEYDWWTGDQVGGVTYEQILDLIKDFKGNEIDVKLTTNGGLLDTAFEVYNILKGHPANVTTTIVGKARSAGTIISMAGNIRKMAKNADYWIHEAQGGVYGSTTDIRSYSDWISAMNERLGNLYADNSNVTKEEALKMMNYETSMSAETALDLGFITEVVDYVDVTNSFDGGKGKVANPENKFTEIKAFPASVQTKLNSNNHKSKTMNILESLKNLFKSKVGQDIELPENASHEDALKATVKALEGITDVPSNKIVKQNQENIVALLEGMTKIQSTNKSLHEENKNLKEDISNLKKQINAVIKGKETEEDNTTEDHPSDPVRNAREAFNNTVLELEVPREE